MEYQSIEKLRESGFVIVIISPDELMGANPEDVAECIHQSKDDIIQGLLDDAAQIGA
jgi:hypothetical protein